MSYTVNGKSLTKVTFTNLHIIRVGPAGGPNARGISSSLTVIVTLQQAQDLKWLLDNTNYKYVLKAVDEEAMARGEPKSLTHARARRRPRACTGAARGRGRLRARGSVWILSTGPDAFG